MPRLLVAGASGFAGALAAWLTWRHPDFELAAITARAEAGQRLDELYPRYRVPLKMEELDLDRHGDVDAAIVAYPHAAAAPVVAGLRARGVRVVDLSADYRLRSLQTYERWYGEHPHPELFDEAVYGLAPLARAGLLADVVIDAKQGISGAGRTPTAETHYAIQAGENIVPYKVDGHRHTPEIEEQLALLGADLRVHFTPHLVSLDQGEMCSCYVTPTRPVTPAELRGLYEAAYGDEPFVELANTPPGVREMRDTNFCRLHALVQQHTGKVTVLSAIDNMWKGTSSQAVQNLNLMFGFDETAGLA